jgi:hypothetical protein
MTRSARAIHYAVASHIAHSVETRCTDSKLARRGRARRAIAFRLCRAASYFTSEVLASLHLADPCFSATPERVTQTGDDLRRAWNHHLQVFRPRYALPSKLRHDPPAVICSGPYAFAHNTIASTRCRWFGRLCLLIWVTVLKTQRNQRLSSFTCVHERPAVGSGCFVPQGQRLIPTVCAFSKAPYRVSSFRDR